MPLSRYLTEGRWISPLTFHQDFLNYDTLVNAAQVGPALDLTRTTTKPYFDASGNLVLTAHNLMRGTDDMTGAEWGDGDLTTSVTTDETAPFGSETYVLTNNTATGNHHIRTIDFPYLTTTGETTTLSVLAKAGTAGWLFIEVQEGTPSYQQGVYFNLSLGTVGTTGVDITGAISDEGDGWYRCSVTRTHAGTQISRSYIHIKTADAQGGYTGASETLYLAAPQQNYGTTPLAYLENSSGTAANYAGPAFDHDPANSNEPLGLLINEAHTNLLLQNRDFTTTWTQLGTPTEVQDQTGIDGVANKAWTLGDDDAASSEGFRQLFTVADDSLTHTIIVPILKDTDETRFPQIYTRLYNGTEQYEIIHFNTKTGAVVETTGDGSYEILDWGDWWGVAMSLPNNSTGNTGYDLRIYPAIATVIGTGSNAATGSIVVDMPSLWKSSNWYYPVETAGSSVTVNQDTYKVSGTSFYDSTRGTWLSSFDMRNPSSQQVIIRLGNPSIMSLTAALKVSSFDETSAVTANPAITASVVANSALGYDGSSRSATTDGTTVVTGAFDGDFGADTDDIGIGSKGSSGASPMNGHMRSIKYWNTRKTDAELQALTT